MDAFLPNQSNMFQQLTLERIPVIHSNYAMPKDEIMRRGDWEQFHDNITGVFRLSLRSWIHGLPDEEIRINRRYPADWWQAFKARWFPAWALVRWPVQYEIINIREKRYKAVCPYIQDAKNNEPYLRWMLAADQKIT